MVFTILVATCADANGYHGFQPLLHIPNEANNLFGAVYGCLDFHDCRHHLFVHDVFAKRPRGHIAHQRRNGILLLERNAHLRQSPAHLLNLGKAGSHARPAKFNREPDLAHFHATGHVVGLHFFGTAAFHAGRFMRHARI